MQCSRVLKEDITPTDFRGETRRSNRKVISRSKELARQIERWIKVNAKRELRRIMEDIKLRGPEALSDKRVKKATDEWDDKTLLAILRRYGVRQIVDTGREFAGSEWKFAPTAQAAFIREKTVQIQGMKRGMQREMRQSVATALSGWLTEDPQPSLNEISNRLSSWLTVSSAAETPRALKPLGQRFTSHGIGARARMIARTEQNQARNIGRIQAAQETGAEYLLWLANNDGKSGERHHEELHNMVVRVGEEFVNPLTGARLRYPGDQSAKSPFGVAGEIINCRCSVRPITEEQARALGVL